MSFYIKTCSVIVGILLISCCSVVAEVSHSNTGSVWLANKQDIDREIRDKLAFYDQQFPEIEFIYLSDGDEWSQALGALDLLLGYQPVNLDYEHPPELREDLLFVTVAKIQMMLVYRAASSYLFKVGELAAAKRDHVCVITLDPKSMALSDEAATRHMLDLTDDEFRAIPRGNYLNKDAHLNFLIDHEVYHCLDTFYHGPITRSEKEFWGKYLCYRRERQADIYALAMHIQRNQGSTPYVRKIQQLRGMTLLNGELQHLTDRAIGRLLDSDQKQWLNRSPEEIIERVKLLDKPLELSYEEYLGFRFSALEAMRRLGKESNEILEPIYPKDRKPNKNQVEQLLQKTTGYYKAYVGREYVFTQ